MRGEGGWGKAHEGNTAAHALEHVDGMAHDESSGMPSPRRLLLGAEQHAALTCSPGACVDSADF